MNQDTETGASFTKYLSSYRGEKYMKVKHHCPSNNSEKGSSDLGHTYTPRMETLPHKSQVQTTTLQGQFG